MNYVVPSLCDTVNKFSGMFNRLWPQVLVQIGKRGVHSYSMNFGSLGMQFPSVLA